MEKKTIFYLISGRAGVGKTTLAGELYDKFLENGYRVIKSSFARGVKDVARQMGWGLEKNERGRKLLQNIGNVGREYHKNTWVNYTLYYLQTQLPGEVDDLSYFDIVIIDDWRFPNELEALKILDFVIPITVRIHAPQRESLTGKPEYNDISETSLSENPGDYDYFIFSLEDDIDAVEKQSNFLFNTAVREYRSAVVVGEC